MKLLSSLRGLVLVVACACGAGLAAETQAKPVTVFAAASMREALDDVAVRYEAETGTKVILSYAGSSSLARQIEAGAPADVFISANSAWMDVLQTGGHITADSRVDLLSNRLVLVGPTHGPTGPVELTAKALTEALQDGKLAMALVDAVPAGIYGKQALQALDLWADVSEHVAQTDNVRAAMALVAIGAAPLGIVYATDAQADKRVTVRARFAPELHDDILYPVAATTRADPDAVQPFLDYLHAPSAQGILIHHGFTVQHGKD